MTDSCKRGGHNVITTAQNQELASLGQENEMEMGSHAFINLFLVPFLFHKL